MGTYCTHVRTYKHNSPPPTHTKAHLHIQNWHALLGFGVMSGNPVDCLWDEVQHKIEVHFFSVCLQARQNNW